MPFANTNNIATHYEVHGEGDPLVLVHDLGSSAADWERQVPVLARHHKVVTLSLRGFGLSDKPRGAITVEQMAADVVALMNHLDMPQAHILGHGLGGAVAFQLAVDQPGRLASVLVLNGVPCYELEYWRRYLMVVSRIGAGSGDGMGGIARYVARQLFPAREQAALRRQLYERQRGNDRACYLATLRALAGWSVTRRLSSVRLPVFGMAAAQDYCPPEEAFGYLRDLEDARLVVIENSRHGTLWDQPAELNRLILDFLADLGARTKRPPSLPGDALAGQAPAAGGSADSTAVPPN